MGDMHLGLSVTVTAWISYSVQWFNIIKTVRSMFLSGNSSRLDFGVYVDPER